MDSTLVVALLAVLGIGAAFLYGRKAGGLNQRRKALKKELQEARRVGVEETARLRREVEEIDKELEETDDATRGGLLGWLFSADLTGGSSAESGEGDDLQG